MRGPGEARALVLTHPEADFLAYSVYDGLCCVLGVENVVEYPWKRSYHGETDRYPSMYTNHAPEVKGLMWEESDEGPQGLTAPFDWAVAWPGTPRSREEIRALLEADAFDLVVCESPRSTVLHSLRCFRDVLPPRLVLVDGEDYSELRVELVQEFGIGIYLKRELTAAGVRQAEALDCWVRPFSFASSVPAVEEMLPAEIDVLCAVGATHPHRGPVLDLIDRLRAEGLRVDTERRAWRNYIDAIRRSRIALAPRGFGQDTLRRWEIPGANGALLFAERLALLEERPLQDGEHCVLYADASDLEQKLRRWLAEEPRRLAVAAAGHAFVQAHHTNAARARQLLGLCRERSGPRFPGAGEPLDSSTETP